MKKNLFSLILLVMTLASCNTSEKILYFQDIVVNRPEVIEATRDITLQPMDQISILVSSKDPELAALFNLSRAQYRVGNGSGISNYNGEMSGYTIDELGEIDFPVLGKLHVGGMTKSEVAAMVKKRLIDESLVNDPVVTVEFMNLYFSVLGEVRNPGRINVETQRFSVLDALAKAGDLTEYGLRDGVIVIREENGQKTYHRLNLNDAAVLSSPYFYLQQNDVVYVEPNKIRRENSKYNQNNAFKLSVISTIVSACSVVVSLIIALSK